MHASKFLRGALLCVCIFCFDVAITPAYVNAHVVVSVDVPKSGYVPGDVIVVPVRLESRDTCVNAVSATITYDATRLTALDTGRGRSILSLWTEAPLINQEAGRVTFSGGIPGGYCGRLIGDPGITNVLLDIAFSITPTNNVIPLETTITVAGATVHAHDGRGTLVPVTTSQGVVVIDAGTTTAPVNEWLSLVRSDTIAPELFDVILNTDPNVARGRYYITFSTLDKQSGLSHFEVLETDPNRWGFVTWIDQSARWTGATSPYVLRDQSLRSTIQVKAVDKAGNERIVSYQAPEHLVRFWRSTDVAALLIFLLICGALVFFIVRTRKTARRIAGDSDVFPTLSS